MLKLQDFEHYISTDTLKLGFGNFLDIRYLKYDIYLFHVFVCSLNGAVGTWTMSGGP